MNKRFPRRNKTTARTRQLKEAILASFGSPAKEAIQSLHGFDDADWQSVLWWLDISGMAIYFFHEACQVGAKNLLPKKIEEDLALRLRRNRVRMNALIQEARTLATWFDQASIPYALLKGITLTPESVADAALRCQTDLDFLVSLRSKELATHYISRLGYRFHARHENTIEFRAGRATAPDLANIYSIHAQRALELHLLPQLPDCTDLLTRRVPRECDGATIYGLSPADILVQQALHMVKHVCGEHTRVSWVLEFWQHVNARHDDLHFWSDVQSIAAEEPNGDLAMGMALWVAEDLFGSVAGELPTRWRTDALPTRVRLWLQRYARNLLLSDAIGNKLYALLRNEIPSGNAESNKTHEILFPSCLPVAVTDPQPHETFVERLGRYLVEADFFLRRLQFHFVEGIHFALEASRWKRATMKCGE